MKQIGNEVVMTAVEFNKLVTDVGFLADIVANGHDTAAGFEADGIRAKAIKSRIKPVKEVSKDQLPGQISIEDVVTVEQV